MGGAVSGNRNPVTHSILLTDAEAEELVTRLSAMLARRKELIAIEPAMANWSDHVMTTTGYSNHFSICIYGRKETT